MVENKKGKSKREEGLEVSRLSSTENKNEGEEVIYDDESHEATSETEFDSDESDLEEEFGEDD